MRQKHHYYYLSFILLLAWVFNLFSMIDSFTTVPSLAIKKSSRRSSLETNMMLQYDFQELASTTAALYVNAATTATASTTTITTLETTSSTSSSSSLTTLIMDSFTFLLSDSSGGGGESWRQYVPLVVCCFVIIDIVLGSPFVNAITKPLREAQEGAKTGNDIFQKEKRDEIMKSKERVDSELIAKEAIEKARSALELQKYLDETKSDWDRMEERKRKLDMEMQELDATLERKREELERDSK